MKIKTMKFSSERLGGNSGKFCTNEIFPSIWYTILAVSMVPFLMSEHSNVHPN